MIINRHSNRQTLIPNPNQLHCNRNKLLRQMSPPLLPPLFPSWMLTQLPRHPCLAGANTCGPQFTPGQGCGQPVQIWHQPFPLPTPTTTQGSNSRAVAHENLLHDPNPRSIQRSHCQHQSFGQQQTTVEQTDPPPGHLFHTISTIKCKILGQHLQDHPSNLDSYGRHNVAKDLLQTELNRLLVKLEQIHLQLAYLQDEEIGQQNEEDKGTRQQNGKNPEDAPPPSNDGRFSNKLHPWAQHHNGGPGGFISLPAWGKRGATTWVERHRSEYK